MANVPLSSSRNDMSMPSLARLSRSSMETSLAATTNIARKYNQSREKHPPHPTGRKSAIQNNGKNTGLADHYIAQMTESHMPNDGETKWKKTILLWMTVAECQRNILKHGVTILILMTEESRHGREANTEDNVKPSRCP